MNVDILAINEIDIKTNRSNKTNQLEFLKKNSGMSYGVFGKAINFDDGEYGVAILSKYPIISNEVVLLLSGDNEQRVLLVSEIKVPNFDSSIVFMTTHLDWQEDSSLRLKQINTINAYTIESIPSKIPELTNKIKILAGDFNDVMDKNSNSSLKEIQRYYVELKKNNIDARTWASINPALDLDHIFAFKGQKWEVLSEKIPTKSKNNKNLAEVSDHLPIILNLRLLEQ